MNETGRTELAIKISDCMHNFKEPMRHGKRPSLFFYYSINNGMCATETIAAGNVLPDLIISLHVDVKNFVVSIDTKNNTIYILLIIHSVHSRGKIAKLCSTYLEDVICF